MAVTQLEDHGKLHPDTHMAFLQCEMEAQPDAAAAMMTQLSMKAGLKAWGKGAEKAAKAEMTTIAFVRNVCTKALVQTDQLPEA